MSEERGRSRWAKLVAEGAMVVLSILIAFWLDAWWNGLQEMEEVRDDLQNVAEEILANRATIEGEVELLQRMVTAGGALVAILSENADQARVSVTDTLVTLALLNPTLDLSFGALDALVASGRLARIPDSELRLLLAGLRDHFLDAVEDEAMAGELLRLHADVLFATDFENVFRANDAFWDPADWSVPPSSNPFPSFGTVEVANSETVRNLYRLRIAAFVGASVELGAFDQRLSRALERIDSSQPEVSGGSEAPSESESSLAIERPAG